jgi:RNA polymerase sigma factor (sigma-70 family)
MQKTELESIVSITDNEIIEKVLAGEKSLYELIMRRYNQRLYRVGFSILKNETDVEDAMQESYIKAYQHLRDFEKKSSFGTWLTRIMINECLQKQKRRSVSKTIDAFGMSNFETYPLNSFGITVNKTPEQHVLNRELRNVLQQAILSLPENYGQVYIMREVEEMSVKETSECLQITETNVKVRLNRAKAILKQRITKAMSEAEVLPFHLSRCNRIVEKVMKRIE